eukprot:gene13203-15597_t
MTKVDEEDAGQSAQAPSEGEAPVLHPKRLRMNVLIEEQPCKMCCTFCGMWVFTLIAAGGLMASGTLEYSPDTPFYDRSINEQKWEDAFTQGTLYADSLAHAGSEYNDDSKCENDSPTVLSYDGQLETEPKPSSKCNRYEQLQFTVLYLAKDASDNVLNKETLEAIQEVEQKLREVEETSRYCQLVEVEVAIDESQRSDLDAARANDSVSVGDQLLPGYKKNYTACRRPQSVSYSYDSAYWDYSTDSGLGYYFLDADSIYQTTNYDEANLEMVAAYWQNYTAREYNLSGTGDLTSIQSSDSGLYVDNLFSPLTANGFSQTGTTHGLRSVFSFGLPIDGYKDDRDGRNDQLDKIGEFLFAKYAPELEKLSIAGVELYWSDDQDVMSAQETLRQIMLTMIWLAMAIIYVYGYLMWSLDSLFLASAGLMQILFAMFPSLLLYRFICQQTYFGTLNVIAIFIIIGIGVDDIFVFFDDWTGNKAPTTLDRLEITWRRSSKAMLSTSVTTIISFFSNSTSVFPAVSTFGLFAAMMVFSNFCAVISFFPACMMVHHKYIKGNPRFAFDPVQTLSFRLWHYLRHGNKVQE